ncbi:hypothetical protein [Nocardiopsis xinjiangensis]|uniref:hypothetical protein n=1 Tax=Nocardiopsis xinjiangensis TaxID=124285 RepID=UPI001268EA11|nr:hypothetical protein [Nocardiopsis xinjiangensis]
MNVNKRAVSAVSVIGLAAGALYAAGAAPAAAENVTQRYTYEDGAELSFTLPGDSSTTCDIEIVASGSNGADSDAGGTGLGRGGHATQVTATVRATPGEDFTVNTAGTASGGRGATGGDGRDGGDGGTSGGPGLLTLRGGGGGGATVVTYAGEDLVIAAGGGGGAGRGHDGSSDIYYPGGNGGDGGQNGQDGRPHPDNDELGGGGGGATADAPGAGGKTTDQGLPGAPGSGGMGGDGAEGPSDDEDLGAAGGGGGGGAQGGGGGGSAELTVLNGGAGGGGGSSLGPEGSTFTTVDAMAGSVSFNYNSSDCGVSVGGLWNRDTTHPGQAERPGGSVGTHEPARPAHPGSRV